MNYDHIELEGLRVTATHGVLDFEKETPQEFVVDVVLRLDTDAAAESDDVADTAHYGEMADRVVSVMTGPSVNLIETLAHRVLDVVLTDEVYDATVTIHKPTAPIAHQFGDVRVKVTRKGPLYRESGDSSTRVVIGLGSNLGHSEALLREAIDEIEAMGTIVGRSEFYRSEPVLADGQDSQPDYLNGLVVIETSWSPMMVLEELQAIENRHGRVRTERWGARTLDLDIIDFAGMRADTRRLTLPHPRAQERRFVLEPWYSIDPGATLGGRPVVELLAQLDDQQVTVAEDAN